MEALGPDILEATAYAQKMTPEEIEETINYLLDEVLSSSAVTADLWLTSRIEYSMGRILLVAHLTSDGLCDRTILFPF